MKQLFWLAIFSVVLVNLGLAQDRFDEELIDTYDENALTTGESYARLTFAGRDVAVLHENGERQEAVVNFPISSGDLLETGHQSYSELEFIDGSLMQFAHRSKVEFQAINETYDDQGLLTVIRLYDGELMLHVTDENEAFGNRLFRVDTESGSAYIEAPGIYSVEQDRDRMRVKVYRGVAELAGERGSRLINSGEYANIHDFDRPTFPIPFNAFRGGSFERWAYERRPGGFGASAKYVDRSISTYARDLDDHGRWRYSREYDTHVWVPYVKSSWRPYWNGFWTRSGVALTWVSYDPFGWVTHHYGRWGYHSDWGYYWVPNRYYSPAWVAWTSYDSYVGWCPLGFRNRPYYYGLSVSIGRHHNYWNYIPAHSIVIGRRVYSERRAVPRHRRKIIINNVYVSRDDLRDAKVLTRVIREPKVNRERRTAVTTRRGYLVSNHGNEATRSAVRIQSRDSGTRAKPRFSTRVRPGDGASILRTDRENQGTVTRSDGTTSRSNSGASVLRRDGESSRSGTERQPLSPLPNRTAERTNSNSSIKTRDRSGSTVRETDRSNQSRPSPQRSTTTQRRESSTSRSSTTTQQRNTTTSERNNRSSSIKRREQSTTQQQNTTTSERDNRSSSAQQRQPSRTQQRNTTTSERDNRSSSAQQREQSNQNYRRSAYRERSSSGSQSGNTRYRSSGSRSKSSTPRYRSSGESSRNSSNAARSRSSSSSRSRESSASKSSSSRRSAPSANRSNSRPAVKRNDSRTSKSQPRSSRSSSGSESKPVRRSTQSRQN